MNASRSLLTNDKDGVREFCIAMFDLDPGDDLAKALCQAWQAERRGKWETSCGPAIWMKRMLRELWVFPRHTGTEFDNERLPVTLHVFFITLEESPDMLALLHNERIIDEPRYARSKISKTQLRVNPINALTESVVRWKWQSRADGRELYMEPAEEKQTA